MRLLASEFPAQLWTGQGRGKKCGPLACELWIGQLLDKSPSRILLPGESQTHAPEGGSVGIWDERGLEPPKFGCCVCLRMLWVKLFSVIAFCRAWPAVLLSGSQHRNDLGHFGEYSTPSLKLKCCFHFPYKMSPRPGEGQPSLMPW